MSSTMQTETDEEGRVVEERWLLPTEEGFLETLLRDLFENHHRALTFGPIIEGAAYELKAPGKPEKVTLYDGYLTIHWGGAGHLHLCIGRNEGAARGAGGEALVAHRRPGRAELFRGLDGDGHPVTWGFRMANGKGEPQISIFFPNPFLTDDDGLADAPDFSRLALWDHVRSTYAGAPADGRDRLGKGFGKG